MAMNRTTPSMLAGKTAEIGTNQEYLCDTQVKLNTISYTWVIQNFEFCTTKIGESISSPKFPDAVDRKFSWFLHVYPNGYAKEDEGYVSMYLNCVPKEICARFSLSLVNSEMQKVKTGTSVVREFTEKTPNWGFPKFIGRDFLLNDANQLLTNKAITIFCEISLVEDIVHTSKKLSETHFQVFDLVDNLSKLFESEQYSDSTITVDNKKFCVHRAILSMRSPSFAAMFNTGAKGRNKNNVDIADIDYEVMKEMLRFVYTSKVNNIAKVAERLLAAADKYTLGKLKLMCEEALQTAITVNDATKYLILADLHNAEFLKAKSIDFINDHCKQVQNTEGYKSMIKSHPHLLAEAYAALSAKVHSVANEALLSKDAKKMKKNR